MPRLCDEETAARRGDPHDKSVEVTCASRRVVGGLHHLVGHRRDTYSPMPFLSLPLDAFRVGEDLVPAQVVQDQLIEVEAAR